MPEAALAAELPASSPPSPQPSTASKLLIDCSKKEKSKKKGALTEIREKGVRIKDVRVGDGPVLIEKKGVRVGYVGSLVNGTKFDEGFFSFKLGSKNVVEGWNIGLRGARVSIHKTRRSSWLTTPPS